MTSKNQKKTTSRSNSKFNKFQNQKYKWKHEWNNNVHTSKEITIILGINSFHLKKSTKPMEKVMLSYESYANLM